MATETNVRIVKAPYTGYEAAFRWNGLLCRYSFQDRIELAGLLVDDAVDQPTIDAVMDTLDAVEWYEAPQSIPAVVHPMDLAYEAYMYRTERDVWKWSFALALVTVGVLAVALAWRAGS